MARESPLKKYGRPSLEEVWMEKSKLQKAVQTIPSKLRPVSGNLPVNVEVTRDAWRELFKRGGQEPNMQADVGDAPGKESVKESAPKQVKSSIEQPVEPLSTEKNDEDALLKQLSLKLCCVTKKRGRWGRKL